MNRWGKEVYDSLVWAGGTTENFTKPAFEEVERLKRVPMGHRLPRYSEFYELQTYLDVLGTLKPGRLLDVGSGTGALSNLFSLLGWNVTACDYDASAMKFPGCRFVQADLNKDMPFEPGEFDAIVCKQTIEHLENPNHLIREFARVLRPGGSVMISTPNIASLRARWIFLTQGVPAFFENYWRDHRTIPHYGQLKSMFEEYGFAEVRCYTNRYEMDSLDASVNGRRMRFVAPLLKLVDAGCLPEEIKYGEYLMMHASKQ
jgi:SAM-dependent methyltransferase